MQIETTKDGYPMKLSIELRGVYSEKDRPELFSWYPSPLRFPQYTVIHDLIMQTPWLVKERHEGYLYLKEFAKKFLESAGVKEMLKRVDEKYLTKSGAVVSLDYAWSLEKRWWE